MKWINYYSLNEDQSLNLLIYHERKKYKKLPIKFKADQMLKNKLNA